MAIAQKSDLDFESLSRILNLPNPVTQGEAVNLASLTSSRQTITQAAHGFAAKDVIRWSSGSFVKAKADTDTNARAIGVVESVSGDDFVVVYIGRISGLSGLTAHATYFLSEATEGLLTTTEPGGLYISKPMLVATSTTGGLVLAQRGIVAASASPVSILETQVFN